MSDIAVLIADMVRAGVDPDLIGRTAAALSEREPVKIIDEQAERRRAADRDRKRLRNSAESAETPPETKVPPAPPSKTQTPIPPDNSPSGNISPPQAKPTPRSELLAVLDAEHAEAVI